DGSSDSTMVNTDPYTGEELGSIRAADQGDLDAAYEAAIAAQSAWAEELPQNKRAILEKAQDIMLENKSLIIDWLVKEAGSTKAKATMEFGASLDILKEATTFPYRMEGRILPSMHPGKENRVYR